MLEEVVNNIKEEEGPLLLNEEPVEVLVNEIIVPKIEGQASFVAIQQIPEPEKEEIAKVEDEDEAPKIVVQEESKVPQKEPVLLDITDDMYQGTLDEEIIDRFICILCYGIVIQPLKCTKCEQMVCKRCVNMEKFDKNQISCYKKCGGKNFTTHLKKQEKSILDNLCFSCINDDCKEKVPYNRYYEHLLKTCKVKTYSKVKLPEGACGKQTYTSPSTNGIPTIDVGIIPTLFLEDGEVLDKEFEIKKVNNNRDYDEYGDEEYGNEYGGYGDEYDEEEEEEEEEE